MSTTNLKEQQAVQSIINKKGLIIAGPCSAESEEQLLETALALKQEGKTDILRAGIWKPRTNPGGFEGAGVKGLEWLLKAKQKTGLKTAVEVATSKHVEDALSFDVDVLWIGARTTVNPFSVQQIADSLKGVKLPVLIKNPVNADIKLWIGALERIQKAGIESIGLIHRGFTSFGNTEYRNPPMWQIPIEMKRLLPNYPMICDPSHICGNRENLLSISQKSVDLDYDGIMIETHCNPDAALTDKNQQITPAQLSQLLSNLVKKTAYSNEESFLMELENLREQINNLDEELITLISNRMKVAKHIGDIKKKSKITILQSSRYNEILERAIKKGDHLGLSKEFITTYMESIHIESIRIQNTV
jgi:chorismate mutase